VLLNLIFLTYAQVPEITCEQEFGLQGTTCSPCQQKVHEYSFASFASNVIAKQPPSDKCLIVLTFLYNLIGDGTTTTPAESPTLDPVKVNQAIEKSCDDTANQCSESHVQDVYTEVEKACETELEGVDPKTPIINPSDPKSTGYKAALIIMMYYTAIPSRGFFCNKIGDGKVL